MSGISTHVLDIANGKPAQNVTVAIYQDGVHLVTRTTNKDGRIEGIPPHGTPFTTGSYRLVFEVGELYVKSLFPEVVVAFEVADATQHYHVPLLLSPFGYSVYRGS